MKNDKVPAFRFQLTPARRGYDVAVKNAQGRTVVTAHAASKSQAFVLAQAIILPKLAV